MFSGWPQKKVFDLPFKEVLPLVTLALCSLLLPITISGITYLVLICKKRNNFKNKIEHFNVIQPLHLGARRFLQDQCSNFSGDNVSGKDIVSKNVQELDEIPITQNTEIITVEGECYMNSLDKLKTPKLTSATMVTPNVSKEAFQTENISCSLDENEIRKLNLSPNQKDNECRDGNDKLQSPNNPSMSNMSDADQVTLPEAFDSTDLEFNQIELEKNRF